MAYCRNLRRPLPCHWLHCSSDYCDVMLWLCLAPKLGTKTWEWYNNYMSTCSSTDSSGCSGIIVAIVTSSSGSDSSTIVIDKTLIICQWIYYNRKHKNCRLTPEGSDKMDPTEQIWKRGEGTKSLYRCPKPDFVYPVCVSRCAVIRNIICVWDITLHHR